ncbi:MAG: imidazole glycerol phosphate synthase subunit HisH [Sphingosinicella sp.]|nr:imidazole glycerol phosphate synthase subunit HisH [Sphingosinicella sp.]
MSKPVTIIDYGVGNLLSVARGIEAAGGAPRFASNVADVRSAERILLPGVGAFEHCARTLREMGLADAVRDFAATGRPFLGICVGMQLLFDYSLEFGKHEGLGLVSGHVAPIPETDGTVRRKVPHIGWSPLSHPATRESWGNTILEGCDPGRSSFYFVHSFSCIPDSPSSILAEADYSGFPICAAVMHDNITGFQCHPEKSGVAGLGVLGRFLAQ